MNRVKTSTLVLSFCRPGQSQRQNHLLKELSNDLLLGAIVDKAFDSPMFEMSYVTPDSAPDDRGHPEYSDASTWRQYFARRVARRPLETQEVVVYPDRRVQAEKRHPERTKRRRGMVHSAVRRGV